MSRLSAKYQISVRFFAVGAGELTKCPGHSPCTGKALVQNEGIPFVERLTVATIVANFDLTVYNHTELVDWIIPNLHQAGVARPHSARELPSGLSKGNIALRMLCPLNSSIGWLVWDVLQPIAILPSWIDCGTANNLALHVATSVRSIY